MSLPRKQAIGLMATDGGRVLLVKRSHHRAEYAGVWSIPSLPVTPREMENRSSASTVPDHVMSQLTERAFGTSLTITARWVRSGERARHAYHLIMILAETNGISSGSELPLNHEKYTAYAWVTPEEVLGLVEGITGTCGSLLVQELIARGLIDPAIQYLELSPELYAARDELDSWPSQKLWMNAAEDYRLLLEGKSGGSGHRMRLLIHDPCVESFVNALPHRSRIIDIGAGGGWLAEVAGQHEVVSVDYAPPFGVSTRTMDATREVPVSEEPPFDAAVMSLVVQWVDDLGALAQSVAHLVRPGGQALVTLTPPHFTKNGSFIDLLEDPKWVQSEPTRRLPFLTMINHTVGPVRLFPWSVPDVVTTFASAGLTCVRMRQLFLDSYLSFEDVSAELALNPSLSRHLKFPAFLEIVFANRSV